jgi:hypothetical protein
MKSNEPAVFADHRDSLNGPLELHLTVVHGKQSRPRSGINERVWRPARQADVFRPCSFEFPVDAIKLVIGHGDSFD